MGWSVPRLQSGTGKVGSIGGPILEAKSALSSRSSTASNSVITAALVSLISLPIAGLSSLATLPMPFITLVKEPFGPEIVALKDSNSARVEISGQCSRTPVTIIFNSSCMALIKMGLKDKVAVSRLLSRRF